MDSRPPPPPPPASNGRTSTPVGFGSGSSPLTQVQARPLSRASTPGAANVGSPAEPQSAGRSPFGGPPVRTSPSPAPGMSPRPMPGMSPRPMPQSGAARVTSPLARSAVSPVMGGMALSPQQNAYPQPPRPQQAYPQAGMSPQQGYSQPLQQAYPQPRASMPPQPQHPAQNAYPQPPRPQQHPAQQAYPTASLPPQQQQYPPTSLPPQQQQYPSASLPPQQYPAQQAYPQQQMSPPQVGSPPQMGASSRRRLYPEQMASAYAGQQAPQGAAEAPAYSGAPSAAPAFFVPGAGPAPVTSPSALMQGQPMQGQPMQGQPMQGQPMQGPGQPMYGQGQPMQGQGQPMYGQGQGQVDGLTQQFGQMGMAEFQTMVLNGRPDLAALDEAPPAMRLAPGTMCVAAEECAPRFQRSTLNAVPRTDKLLKKTRLPLGLLVTPVCADDDVAVAPDIVRCRRCRTYINPFVAFTDGGRRWRCNMCGLSNDVPLTFDYDSATQTQKDRWSRADLRNAVVEFVAPLEYMVRPPMPPAYVFLIDVSYAAAQLGAPGVVAQTIRDTLDQLPDADGRTRVAIIGVDAQLHFFQMRAGAEPQQLVVGDVDEVVLPAPADLLVNLSDARSSLDLVLERFGTMFSGNHGVGNALGPAIRAAQQMLGGIGGRIVAVMASPPTTGEGLVELRAEGRDLGTPRESELLRAQGTWYKNVAADCSRAQIAFDTVFLGQQAMDVATVAGLARYTGGTLLHYPAFMAGRPEAVRFASEFGRHLAGAAGLEAVLRVRASKGLRMSAYYGHFFLRSLDLLALPSVDPGRCYAVDLEIDETLPPVVYFQTALLHTTALGERRIRVVTQAVPTTDNAHSVFHHADQSAIAALLAKKAVDRALAARLEDAREALQHKTLEILGAFKTLCTQASSGAATQLQVPRALRLLPLLTLATLKHPALRGGNNVRVADRIAAMSLVLTLPPETLLQPLLVPRMYALHELEPMVGLDDESGAVVMPPHLPLSAEVLSPRGIFLVYSGADAILWVGRDVDPSLLSSLVGEPHMQSGVFTFPDLSDNGSSRPGFELNYRTNNVLRALSALCHGMWAPPMFVCREDGDQQIRLLLAQRLVEDMDTAAPSYSQFLNQMRDKINRGSF
ncbi:COPII subunit [Coemansia sp. RSA 1822]|nr:COPII subunit [Coemansia sp. RSA 638]KAJ2567900.1 COPII subunit [Coemansia sp. RSA 1822]